MKGVILDAGSLNPSDLDWTAMHTAIDELVLHPQTQTRELKAHISDAEVILSNKVAMDADTLAQHPSIKLIVILATGTNNIDLEAAARLNIPVCNNVGYSTNSLVEHSLALILTLARRLPAYQQAVQEGSWENSDQFCLLDPPIQQLAGARLGIIGAGASGRGLASIARAIGMETVALESSQSGTGSDPDLPRLPMAQLLSSVDVLSIHCPLTEETRGLIGRKELRQMKNGALLINTARGGIVDEKALCEALEQGQIAGAGLDVLSKEPPVTGNPLLELRHPNLIITPHNAWGSRNARQALLDQSARIIEEFKRGSLINCVNMKHEATP